MAIDIKNLKEELVGRMHYFSDKVGENAWFLFVKEKYSTLSFLHRKIIHTTLWILVILALVYVPLKSLYHSHKKMEEFSDKRRMVQELARLFSAQKVGSSASEVVRVESFIRRGIKKLNIPDKQTGEVKKIKNPGPSAFSLPRGTRTQTLTLRLKDLNLREVIQYGYQVENLSDNLKLSGMDMEESTKKQNYFNVVYTFQFFSLKTDKKRGNASEALKNRSPKKRVKAGKR